MKIYLQISHWPLFGGLLYDHSFLFAGFPTQEAEEVISLPN